MKADKAKTYDVVVVGAGPGGLTAATLLAIQGHRVAVLEKARFPRYRVGESMIPYNYFPLERIGMIEKLQASDFPKKYSVQFVKQDGMQSQPFYFDQHMNHPASQTWQVTRTVFDAMLMDNAREKGVDVYEDMKASELIQEDDRVVGVTAVDALGEEQEFRAAVTIDGSGKGRFAMTRMDWRVFDRNLKVVAVWGYYRGAKRDEGRDEGATTITYLEGKNWFWYIPLRDDIVSVGVVGSKEYIFRESRDLKTIFETAVAKNSWILDHLAPGSLEGDFEVCTHISYRSRYCAKSGLVLVGDALSFLDPVFSTGMFLALGSGELAADAVHAALEAGDVSGASFVDYGEKVCHRIEILRKLVYAFYAERFSFKDIVMKYPHLKGDITDILIGNVDRQFDELNAALAEFFDVPEPSIHGRALV
jgi:flavin-dependent dehydrogenase